MRTKFSARGVSAMLSAWVWTSMKPGATMSPVASIVSGALSRGRMPMAAIRPSLIATSARRRGAPDPSISVPPVMSRS